MLELAITVYHFSTMAAHSIYFQCLFPLAILRSLAFFSRLRWTWSDDLSETW